MTFGIIFYFHQLDVCTSCKLLSECLNTDALKNVTKYFVKKAPQLDLVYLRIFEKMSQNVLQSTLGLNLNVNKSQTLRRAEAVRELILCHPISFKPQADQACCIISLVSLSQSSVVTPVLSHFFPSMQYTVIFPHNHYVYRQSSATSLNLVNSETKKSRKHFHIASRCSGFLYKIRINTSQA